MRDIRTICVMAGLDLAIHVFASVRREDVDAQHSEPMPSMTSQQKRSDFVDRILSQIFTKIDGYAGQARV